MPNQKLTWRRVSKESTRWVGDYYLNKVVREGLSGDVKTEQRPERRKEANVPELANTPNPAQQLIL